MAVQAPPRLDAITDPEEIRRRFQTMIPFADLADDLVDAVARTGCLLRGHFQLLSGQHSSIFLRFSRFASESDNVQKVARALAESILKARLDIDAVLSPDTAGVILAYELARRLDIPRAVARTGDSRLPDALLNHVELPTGGRILLVNDIVTTGRGMQTLRQIAEGRGCSIAGAASFCLRRNPNAQVKDWLRSGERFFTVASLAFANEIFGTPGQDASSECPICTAGVAITRSDKLN